MSFTLAIEQQFNSDRDWHRSHEGFKVDGQSLVGHDVRVVGLNTSPVWTIIKMGAQGVLTLMEKNSNMCHTTNSRSLRFKIKTGVVEVLS